jgi:putative membrane protein
MHGDVGWGWMTVMMGGMVLFWAIVILGIVWLIRGFERKGPSGGESAVSRESPIEILERRFAEGAISPEDYWARRQVLVNGKPEPNGARSEVTVSPSAGASQR